MSELDDHQLLAEFARENSEAAFAALVQRHVNLVYSVALQSVGNVHAAEEITQAVFIILARKAKSFSRKTILSGWLYQTTRLTAANFLRGEIRRQNREQEAYMQSALNEPEPDIWPQIAPLLDDALAKLGGKDRDAIVLRFFENKNLREVGTALGASEDAAKMRVNRALEKLRNIFRKRGVTLTSAAIAGAVSANSVQAAPVGLAATVTAAAAKGAAVSVSTLTLIKGALKIMAWTKMKTAMVGAVTALFAGGVTMVVVLQTGSGDKLTPHEIVKQAQDAYAALSSYSDNGMVGMDAAGYAVTTKFSIRLQRPNQYLINWTQTSNRPGAEIQGSVWSDGTSDYLLFIAGSPNQGKPAEPQKVRDMQMALGSATGPSGFAAATIPGIFFYQYWGDVLGVPASGKAKLTMHPDENVGGVECYVISSFIDLSQQPAPVQSSKASGMEKLGTSTITLWIGKRDHLIHQTRKVSEGAIMKTPQMTEVDIKKYLEQQNKPATPEAIAAWRQQQEASIKQFQAAKVSFTQNHEHIVVNQKFLPADFAR